MRKIKKSFGIITFILLLTGINYSQVIPFNSDRWEYISSDYKIETHNGKESLFMKGGLALIKDSEFLNGTIEFEISFPGKRDFMGVIWRVQDENDFEEFYLRPHQSGNPDANQYTPVFNGISGWQLYHGKEYAVPYKYKYNEWMKVKIAVAGTHAEIYIEDMENPVLFVPELKREMKKGKVGLKTNVRFASAHFANFKFTSNPDQKLKSKIEMPAVDEKGLIKSWQISNSFDSKWLEEKYLLPKEDLKSYSWTKLESENTGITNMARVQGISDGQNSAFVKLVINSSTDQVKQIKFGYSDDVKIFVNGKLIYGGSNTFQSRDYRYLGTIGFFDEIFLHLKKGENEILFAVTETFGGWGILGQIENQEGIEIIY